VAVSDPTGTIASPRGIIERGRGTKGDATRPPEDLLRLIEDVRPSSILVGIPLSMDGSAGEMAVEARRFAANLGVMVGVEIIEWDERLTTVRAEREIQALGLKRSKRRLKGAASELKAGRYRLVAGTGYSGLLETLRLGTVVTIPLTIPEGLTLQEVAPRIADFTGDSVVTVLTLLEDSSWVEELDLPGPTLEGYLFPETYRFSEDTPAPSIVRTMVERYHAFWGASERARADSLGLSERELVTLASIVEKEARVARERPMIAGVYLNRLEIGMLLQADPTVQYALGEHRARLLFRDIDAVADNPYNTYTHAGLPPGPIASPGAAALRATLQPEAHTFLFFVARDDGSHEFTRTNREHINAINRIRRDAPAHRR